MRTVALIAVLAIPFTAAADQRDEVLNAAMKLVARDATTKNAAPYLVASTTAAGAEQFVTQSAKGRFGTVVGEEVANDYVAANKIEHAVSVADAADVRSFERGESYDWTALAQAYPSVRSVVRLSEPAFDRLQNFAVVHFDLMRAEHAQTAVIMLERDPRGVWKPKAMSMGSYDPLHRLGASSKQQ